MRHFVLFYRFEDAIDELRRFLREDELRDIPVLILANKQDIEGAMTPEEITQKVQENKCMDDRHWTVFGVIANRVKDNGLQEAFDWLSHIMVNSEKHKMASELLYGAPKDKTNNKSEKSVESNMDKTTKPLYCSFVESFKKMIM
jgi:hypothetical protein